MSTPAQSPRGRNAEATREALLTAALAAFADHGFAGARIDAIAAAAGYNKSLIFQYFGDKVSLYTEVIKRADATTQPITTRALTALMDAGVLDHATLTPLLREFMGALFDMYAAHPEITRLLLWEMAEGWQTYATIAPALDHADLERVSAELAHIQQAGLFRSDLDPMIQIVLAQFVVMVFLACIPLFQLFFPTAELSAPETLARARTFVIDFTVGGLLTTVAPASGNTRVDASA
jgi:TetR/AcrR family transcriptional regulator